MKPEADFPLPAAMDSPTDVWRAAIAVALTVTAILAVYFGTAASIEAIWRRAETFAHGYVVIPIVLWLLWRRRAALAQVPVRPFWPGVAVVAAFGAVWLVASTSAVLGIEQFALLFMIQAAVVTIVGLRFARAIAFPLAFLLFAVPFGEIFVPGLIDWTADFTVLAVRASGIPVYREGNQFNIPSGAWSVVEACSGIRYLIAALMGSTLYAYLTYRSPWRRVAFVLASLPVPIVANWLRAYLIVMLGHLSGNKIAVSVDHLIYGWVFFGIVILLMFWVGSFWREDGPPPSSARTGVPAFTIPGAARSAGTGRLALVMVAAIAAAIIWRPIDAAVDTLQEPYAPALAPLPATANWAPIHPFSAPFKPHYMRARAELVQGFAGGPAQIGVYVGFFNAQHQGEEMISSANVLVTEQETRWKKLAASRETVTWDGAPAAADRALLGRDLARLVVLRLYWVNGRVTASDYAAKVLLALSKLTGRGDDSAVIVVYAPYAHGERGADETVRRFVAEQSPAIEAMLAEGAEPAVSVNSRPLVLHVVHHFAVGGLENGVVNLINRLPENSWRHAIVALTAIDPAFAQRIRRRDVELVALDKGPGHTIKLFPRIHRLIRDRQPAIVHTRNLAALEAAVPASFAHVPVRIHGEHGRDVGDLDGTRRRYQLVRRLYAPFVTRYVTVSRDLERYLTGPVGIDSRRVEQIYNGVDTARFAPGASERPPIEGSPFNDPRLWLVGTVGRLEAVKDQPNLAKAFVQALAQAPAARERLRLVIAGEGHLRREIQRILDQANAQNLAWLAGERADVPVVLRGLDCFVLPSLAEGISNTILEAMACGLPVIATRVGGNAELMEPGLTGSLVPAADARALAHEILAYFADPALARRHGRAGRNLVERRFSLDRMVEQYQALYSRALAGGPARAESRATAGKG